MGSEHKFQSFIGKVLLLTMLSGPFGLGGPLGVRQKDDDDKDDESSEVTEARRDIRQRKKSASRSKPSRPT